MKRHIAALLVFALFFVCIAFGFSYWRENRPIVLDDAVVHDILSEFDDEIRKTEESHGISIETIDDFTLEYIKDTAIEYLYDPSYSFGSLMDTIAVELTKAGY